MGDEYIVNIIRRTELQPGDIVVLTTEAFLGDATVKGLEAQLRGLLPQGVRVAVCDGGVKVSGIIGTQLPGQGGGSE
jgi:hypothetical protein